MDPLKDPRRCADSSPGGDASAGPVVRKGGHVAGFDGAAGPRVPLLDRAAFEEVAPVVVEVVCFQEVAVLVACFNF